MLVPEFIRVNEKTSQTPKPFQRFMIGWWFSPELRNGKAGSFPYFVILFPWMNPGVNQKEYV
jgi:hypothetical protein